MSNSKNSQAKCNRIPSRRDQEIYTRVVVHCELQCNVAKDLGLSSGRISQILSRVRRWLATGVADNRVAVFSNGKHGSGATDATLDTAFSALEHFSALEIQRLQRHLAQARHEYLYQISIRGIKHISQYPKHTTIRTELKMDAADSETQDPNSKTQNCDAGNTVTRRIVTVRDQPINVQLIKTAQRSAIELQKLAELDPLPPPEIAASEDRRAMAVDFVTELLDDAVASDKVRSVGWDTERDFVEDLFNFLLGERHRGLATNIIAADAQHGRLRPGKRAYPGHDPMLETSGSPDQALKNTKPQPPCAKDSIDQKPAEPLASTPSPTTTSNQPTAQHLYRIPSEIPSKKPANVSALTPPPNIVRLECPVVINPP